MATIQIHLQWKWLGLPASLFHCQAGSEATNCGAGQSNLGYSLVYICLFICLSMWECKKYLIQYAGVATHSVRRRTHKANVFLTITGHELVHISLHIMVENDDGF